jgi:hypothetical protein
VFASAGGVVAAGLGEGTGDGGGVGTTTGAGVGFGLITDGSDEETVEEGVLVDSAGACAEAGVDVPRSAGVFVARAPDSIGGCDEEFTESGLIINSCPDTGVDVATTSAIGSVVPPLTVSCSLGEAKLCQSKVMGVVVAASIIKVKPEASFSAMYAGMNEPSGEKVTTGWYAYGWLKDTRTEVWPAGISASPTESPEKLDGT